MKRYRVRTACLGMVATLTLAGFMANAAAATIKIRISDLAFDPPMVAARPGDIIEWQNDDFIDHTATERGGLWDVALPAGKTTRLTLAQKGTMAYFCKFHPQMTGTVRVDTGP